MNHLLIRIIVISSLLLGFNAGVHAKPIHDIDGNQLNQWNQWQESKINGVRLD
jgi:hypothetical protein